MQIVDVAVRKERFTYPMYLNAPRPPNDSYAAVRCRRSINPGFDERKIITNPEGGLLFKTVGIRVLTFDILFVKEGQDDVEFDNSFYRPDVKLVMRKHGFAALNKYPTDLKNINLESNWEIRRGITCEFNVIRSQEQPIDQMSNADVSGILSMGTENIIPTIIRGF